MKLKRMVKVVGLDNLRASLAKVRTTASASITKACRDDSQRILDESIRDMASQSAIYHLSKSRDRS